MGSLSPTSSAPFPQTTTPPPLSLNLLPAKDSPTIILRPATTLERTQCWHINAHSWRGPLSLAQYLHREAHLEQQSLTRNGQITYWILTCTDPSLTDPDGARPILASCESLLKRGYVARNGTVEEVRCHGIGSVFVRDEYRGRGHARRMMDEVALALNTWQQRQGTLRGAFSVLYSDIGKQYYAKHGWKAMPSTHIVLSPVSEEAYAPTVQRLGLPAVKDLQAKDLASVCADAVRGMEAELATQSSQPHTGKRPRVALALRPDAEHMTWHHAREEFQARTLYDAYPAVKGAIDPATGCAAIWSRVYGAKPAANKLHILHLHIPPPRPGQEQKPERETEAEKSVAALLLRAQREADAWAMRAGVEVWSPKEATLRAARMLGREGEELEVVVRGEESVCSLRWIGDGEVDGEVEWIGNEKYGWC